MTPVAETDGVIIIASKLHDCTRNDVAALEIFSGTTPCTYSYRTDDLTKENIRLEAEPLRWFLLCLALGFRFQLRLAQELGR